MSAHTPKLVPAPTVSSTWKVPGATQPPPGQLLAGTDPLQVLVLPWHPVRTPAGATTPKMFAQTDVLALGLSQALLVSLSLPPHPTGLCHSLQEQLLWEGSWQNQGTPKEIPDFSRSPGLNNSYHHLPGNKESVFGSIKAVG